MEINDKKIEIKELYWTNDDTKETELDLSGRDWKVIPFEIYNDVSTWSESITGLDLSFNFLEEIPFCIQSLKGLRSLNLSNNQLYINPNYSPLLTLTNLTYLNLSQNKLSNFPVSLGAHLQQLKVFFFASNDLISLPDFEIYDFPSLISLNLNYNQIQSLPDTFTRLTNLRDIGLYSNQLNQNSIPLFQYFQFLQKVDLQNNYEIGLIPPILKSTLPNAKFLVSLPNEILPGKLYIGDWEIAHNVAALEALGITHVLTICDEKPSLPSKITNKVILLSDSISQNIYRHFYESIEFINSASGACLVHCLVGISRSATICIAYLMVEKQIDFDSAHQLVKEARPIINPNHGFV